MLVNLWLSLVKWRKSLGWRLPPVTYGLDSCPTALQASQFYLELLLLLHGCLLRRLWVCIPIRHLVIIWVIHLLLFKRLYVQCSDLLKRGGYGRFFLCATYPLWWWYIPPLSFLAMFVCFLDKFNAVCYVLETFAPKWLLAERLKCSSLCSFLYCTVYLQVWRRVWSQRFVYWLMLMASI